MSRGTVELKGVDGPVLRLVPTHARFVVPAYQSALAAGLDLSACVDEAVELLPRRVALVSAGFRMSLEAGYEAQVRPRSGLATRHGVTLPNAPGTIDADYRGEVLVPLINLLDEVFVVEPGMRVAQMVIAPVSRARLEVVEELGETVRGAGGFGSTGLTGVVPGGLSDG